MGRALGRGLPTWQLGADETTPMARFSCRSACVRFWHNADIPVAPIHVNVAGERRCHATGTRASQFTAKQSCEPLRSARCVLDRRFEALCVEGRHTLDPPQTLGGVPDRECEHRLRIRGIDDVDEVVVAWRAASRDCSNSISPWRTNWLAFSNPKKLYRYQNKARCSGPLGTRLGRPARW